MIQDIAPRKFRCEYDAAAVPRAEDRILVFNGSTVVMRDPPDGREDGFLTYGELRGPKTTFRYLFAVDDTRFFMPESPLAPDELPPEASERHTGMFMMMKPKWAAFAGIMGNMLCQWYISRRYCGRCGAETAHSDTERAVVCADCGLTLYPQISPVVIVAVTNGDKLLLTRYVSGPTNRYALVAGFVETGETLEDAVRREVMEETGLNVRNVTYYKSQPWGLSSSLLCGFYCELDGDGAVTVDKSELSEALWVPRAEITPHDTDFALTAEMIEQFRLGRK